MATTEIYDTVGAHTSTVPSGVEWAVIECWGAEGGTSTGPGATASGGQGGYLKARVPVTPGETLNVHVGGAGGAPTGGANGGGDGARVAGTDPDGESGGGGGASDVRQGGDTLSDRVVVGGAGAGGGAAEGSGAAYAGGDGGYPDGVTGGDSGGTYSDSGGPPGTQTSAGGNGSFGVGGSASQTTAATSGAGAAGWYGGGIGSSDSAYAQAPGGGGGSSYTSGDVLDDTTGARTGDGKVVITYDDAPAAPSGLSATEDANGNVDLSWTDNASTESEFRIYRTTTDSPTFPGDYTQIATVAADTTTYQDTTAAEGTTYSFAVTAWSNYGESSETTAALTTSLEATTNLAIDATNGDQFDLSWTDNSDGEDGYRIYVSTDGGSTWSLDKSVAANTTTATTTDLLDGETYDIEVRPYTSDAEGTSPTVTGTTALPAASAPTLGNGVEDEVAVAIPDVIDNGLYRVQIRETGQSTWDSNATGFTEKTVSADADTSGTEDTTIVGREDGEEYEVRVRTESADAGSTAWTSPVAIVTKFPGAANPSATATSTSAISVTWQDNADNEDGFRIERRDELDPARPTTYGSWTQVADLAPNTTSFNDTGLDPNHSYEYRVTAYTEDASATTTVTEATTDVAYGPYWTLELRRPDGEILTIDGKYFQAPSPTFSRAPSRITPWSVRIPETRVLTDENWLNSDAFLWFADGSELVLRGELHSATHPNTAAPVDSEDGLTTLEGADVGYELKRGGASEQYTTIEAHLAIEDYLTTHFPNWSVTVHPPTTQLIDDDKLIQDPSTTADYNALFGDTDPVVGVNGTNEQAQSAFCLEAEDGTITGGSVTSSGGDYSMGGAVALSDAGDAVSVTFDLDYTVPTSAVAARYRLFDPQDTGVPGYEVRLDGTTIGSFGGQSGSAFPDGWYTAGEFAGDGWTGGDLAPGEHTLTFEVTSANGEVIYPDILVPYDARWSYTWPNSTDSGSSALSGPAEFPVITATTAVTDLDRNVVSATISSTWDDTSGAQALAVSNDNAATFEPSGGAGNTETLTESFDGPGTQVAAKIWMDGYTTDSTTTPSQGDTPQAISDWELTVDTNSLPVLDDRRVTGDHLGNIQSLCDDAGMIWVTPYSESGKEIEVFQPGDVTATLPDIEIRDGDEIFDREQYYNAIRVFGADSGDGSPMTATTESQTEIDQYGRVEGPAAYEPRLDSQADLDNQANQLLAEGIANRGAKANLEILPKAITPGYQYDVPGVNEDLVLREVQFEDSERGQLRFSDQDDVVAVLAGLGREVKQTKDAF